MNDNLILQKALENGLINLDAICMQMEIMEREEILRDYPYSVWQGSNGYWYTKIKEENGNRKLVRKHTRKEVEDFIVDSIRNQKPTLEKAFNEWIKRKSDYKEICQGTVDRYCNDFKRYFTEIKDMKIDRITEEFLEDYVKSTIAKDNLSAKAYSNMRTLLNGTFKYAKKKHYTDISISSFFGDIEISRKAFRKRQLNKEEQVFNDDEKILLMRYLWENASVVNLGILLTFQTGIRMGELSALKYSDVIGHELHIQRQEIRYRVEKGKQAHEIVDYTKSEAGNRYILLPDEALATIEKIKELNPDNELMMMDGDRKFYASTYNERLKRACRNCGIPERSMHKIRKTYGSFLIDSDLDDSLIMSQLGHSDITTTRKYYYFSHTNTQKKLLAIQRAFDSCNPFNQNVTP